MRHGKIIIVPSNPFTYLCAGCETKCYDYPSIVFHTEFCERAAKFKHAGDDTVYSKIRFIELDPVVYQCIDCERIYDKYPTITRHVILSHSLNGDCDAAHQECERLELLQLKEQEQNAFMVQC